MTAPPAGVVPLNVEFSMDTHRFLIECIDTRTTEAITISGSFSEPLRYTTQPPSSHRLALAQLIRAAMELAKEENQ